MYRVRSCCATAPAVAAAQLRVLVVLVLVLMLQSRSYLEVHELRRSKGVRVVAHKAGEEDSRVVLLAQHAPVVFHDEAQASHAS